MPTSARLAGLHPLYLALANTVTSTLVQRCHEELACFLAVSAAKRELIAFCTDMFNHPLRGIRLKTPAKQRKGI